jgi:tetratricopeptide (TPR) repeat protein
VVVDPRFSRARLWAAQTYFRIASGSDGWSRHAKAESLIAPLIESRGQLSRYERCRLDYVIALGRSNDRAALYDAARCMADAAPGSDDAKRELAMLTESVSERLRLLSELDPDRGLLRQWGNYWCVLGNVYYELGDYEADLRVAQEARQRFPETPHRLMHEARALAALGRSGDASAVVETLLSLPSTEDLGPWLYAAAHWIRVHGDHAVVDEALDAAIAWYRSRPQDTEQWRAELANAVYEARRWGDALHMYQELAEEYPDSPTHLGALGRLAARRGDREAALRVSEELQTARYPPRGTMDAVLERARIAALLGDRDEAVTLAQAFVYQLPSGLTGRHLRADIDFESLYDHPPFQKLMPPNW